MAEILPYLGIEPTYTAEELMGADTTVPYVVGMTREEAQQRVKDRGFGCQIVGDGDTITDQTPAGGAIIPGNATVILYAGAEKATELCTVPNLLGRTASEANSLASNAGLILRFTRRHQQHLRQHRGAESGCRGRCSGGARHRSSACSWAIPASTTESKQSRKEVFSWISGRCWRDSPPPPCRRCRRSPVSAAIHRGYAPATCS